MKSVRIRGDGIAAWCCARLLSNHGIAVTIERPTPRARPWILVNQPAQRLLCDFAGDPDLFRDTPKVHRRTVAWGAGSAPASFEHCSAIVAEQDLLDRLWPMIPESHEPPEWSIVASGAKPMQDFGSRVASVSEVELRASRGACWIESFDQGWLFLIAGANASGRLISVGAPAPDLLRSSRVIAPEIDAVGAASGQFPAHPRILSPMFAEDWLACGSAAMTLDPLCGDGCGHALREAILAAAVIRGGAEPAMLEHYESRLRLAFDRHLAMCRDFYVAGRSGAWWDQEIARLEEGLTWTRAHAAGQWRYRLEGFDLIAAR